MAKVVGPLFSVDARGKLADSLVVLGWRGRKTVRMWKKPANPKTAAQQLTRGYFTSSVAKYHTLAGGDQLAFKLRASGKPYSGFNLFVDLCKTTLDAAKKFVTIKNVNVPTGTITTAVAVIKATADRAGATGVGKISYGTDPGVYYAEKEVTWASGTSITATLTGLTKGVKYYFRCIFPEVATAFGETGDYTFTTKAS
jgi:hypothetical protein